jgi:hypothetical protein
MIRGREGCYGRAVTKRLAAMGIRDHPIAPRSAWRNGHAERLIGSIRRECLDHIVVFVEVHLRRILDVYARDYNEIRTSCPWTRIRRAVGRPSASASSLPSQSSADFTVNTAERTIQQGQVIVERRGALRVQNSFTGKSGSL